MGQGTTAAIGGMGDSLVDGTATESSLEIALFSLPYWFQYRDPRIDSSPISYPSLTVPYLVGHLESHGYSHVRHYDLELIFQRFLNRNRHAIELDCLTPENAALYLKGQHDGLGRFVTRLVDTARVSRADLFGFSLSLQDCEGEVGPPAFALTLGLIRYLKQRYPESRTVIGGLVMREQTAVRGHLLTLLRSCTELDWAVEGRGDDALLRIVAATENGGEPEDDPAILSRYTIRLQDAEAAASAPRTPSPLSKSVAKKNESAPLIPSVFQWAEERRASGAYLADLYALSEATRRRCASGLSVDVLPLTLRFMDGCSNRCAYCRWSDMAVIASSVKDVVRTLGKMVDKYGANSFIFMNTCLNWSNEYALSFALELRRANLGILWTDSIAFSRLDERLIAALRESGFCRADMGAETASDRLLKIHNKAMTYASMVAKLKLLNDYGIFTYLNMIAGLPGETEEDVQLTLSFIRETAAYANGYIVNAFYVHEDSRLGLQPGRFGVEVLGHGQATEQGIRIPYSVEGREFEDLCSTAHETRRRMYAEIEKAQGGIFDDLLIDYHLIFWLYRVFGHDNKPAITKVIKEAVARRRKADEFTQQSYWKMRMDGPREQEIVTVGTDESTEVSLPRQPTLSPPLAELLDRLSDGTLSFDVPGLAIVRTEAKDNDVLSVTMELAGATLPFGVMLADRNKPSFVAGQLLSIFHYKVEGTPTETLALAAGSLCRSLEQNLADNRPAQSFS
jgi:radical SAM superfamily enzyme YgiQ (UPF0313 family)